MAPPLTLFPDVEGGVGEVDAIIPTIDETAGGPMAEPISEQPLGQHGFMSASLSARKLILCFAVFFLMFGALGVRAAYLELGKGGQYLKKAEGNSLRIVAVPAERGVIYDRNGTLLVRNVPDFTLTMTPADLPKERKERDDLIARLAQDVDLFPVDIEKALRKDPKNPTLPVPVKLHLDYEQAVKLEIQSGSLPGVAVVHGTKREIILNPNGEAAPVMSLSHVIGYEGLTTQDEIERFAENDYLLTDFIGKTGVEAFYEKELRGTYGKKQIEVDASGREQDILASEEAVQGKDLTLTIDSKLQAEAERSLKASAARNGRGRGSAVALDAKTGAILAIVSWPSFDANDFAKGISTKEYRELIDDKNQPLFPRAVSGTFPPGSTIKTVVATGALMDHVITPSTTVLSTGGIRLGGWFFPDWKPGGHGITNVTKAIAQSVNTFFYAIGGGWNDIKGLGIEGLDKYFRIFGLGSRLGVDLPGEGKGFVPTADWKKRVTGEDWYPGDTYHVSIGQGALTVTPLQVATWTAVFADGGNLLRPHVVKEIRSSQGSREVDPGFLAKGIVPKDVVETVRGGMRQTILSGSAQGLKISPWTIAGKTGTAQWGKPGEPTHAWFAGFAPYDDPKIVVAVMVEAGGEGTHSAAPVARDIMEAWLRSQGVKPDNPLYHAPAAPIDSASETGL